MYIPFQSILTSRVSQPVQLAGAAIDQLPPVTPRCAAMDYRSRTNRQSALGTHRACKCARRADISAPRTPQRLQPDQIETFAFHRLADAVGHSQVIITYGSQSGVYRR